MSKITKDDLTQSGTGCFRAVPTWQQWASKGCSLSYKFNVLTPQSRLKNVLQVVTKYRS